MDDGSLIGAHFTNSLTDAKILKEITAHGGSAVRMYLTGHFYEHVRKHGGKNYTGKAELIGYTGDVFCFDTQTIKPKQAPS